jgi:hypothetical protein
MSSPLPADRSHSPPTWAVVAAALWLLLFSVYFYTRDLPNNSRPGSPLNRSELLANLPFLWLEVVDPTPPEREDAVAWELAQLTGWRNLPQRFDLLATAFAIVVAAAAIGRLILRLLRLLPGLDAVDTAVFGIGIGLLVSGLATLGFGLAGVLEGRVLGGVLLAAMAVEAACIVAGFRSGSSAGNTDPSASDPRATDPAASHPSATHTPASHPSASHPSASHPSASHPSASHPSASHPSASDPSASDPRTSPPNSTSSEPARISHWEMACGAMAIAAAWFVGVTLLSAMLPSTDFDANAYHLQGPKEYFQNGRIGFLPHNVYTSFPFHSEMLTLLSMVLHGEWYRGALAGKTLLAVYGLLTCGAVFLAARDIAGPKTGVLAAFVHLTIPWTYRVSSIAGAEGSLSFYLIASFVAASRAVRDDSRAARGDHAAWSLLAGLLAGGAMACKYPGLISVVAPVFVYLAIEASRNSRTGSRGLDSRRLVSTVLLYTVGVAIAVGPWLLKNLFETGNPVYPLAWRVFGGTDWDADLNAKWQAGHSAPHFRPLAFLTNIGDVAAVSDWCSGAVFALAPLAVLISPPSRRRLVWPAVYIAWLYASWWLLTHRIDRFWVPLLPVASMLAGIGAAAAMRLTSDPGPRSERRTSAVTNFALAFAAMGVLTLSTAFNGWFITSGAAGYNAFLLDLDAARQFTQTRFAGDFAYLNSTLPANAKVLCVGEAEVFESEVPVLYNTVFDRSLFQDYCGDPNWTGAAGDQPLRNQDEIAATFRSLGITHVLVNWSEILRYRTTYGYTDFVHPGRFAELQALGILGPPVTPIDAFIPLDADESIALRGMDPNLKNELERWGPELIVNTFGRRAMPSWQVYPVVNVGGQ